jgi:hypothetical protein
MLWKLLVQTTSTCFKSEDERISIACDTQGAASGVKIGLYRIQNDLKFKTLSSEILNTKSMMACAIFMKMSNSCAACYQKTSLNTFCESTPLRIFPIKWRRKNTSLSEQLHPCYMHSLVQCLPLFLWVL